MGTFVPNPFLSFTATKGYSCHSAFLLFLFLTAITSVQIYVYKFNLESGEKLKLLQEGSQGLHELLTGMVVLAFVRRDDNSRVSCKPLYLFLHIARMVRASIVAPARSSSKIIRMYVCV